SLAHTRTSQLARAQAAAVRAAGGVPVPLAQVLAPKLRATRELMFSADGYHPSATAYALAAQALLLALCDVLGEKVESPVPDMPAPASTPVPGQGHARLSVMSWLWRRPVAGSPAPSSSRPVGTD
ncbi:MAG TPA: SGNH/GDSL hydrolase family protein, partial [Mycobacterium sp.]|nr:SGNH/GDSL hydrolase family protein [Mycobacterium sp.]